VRTLCSHLIGTVGRVIAIAELGSADSVPPLASQHDADTFRRLAERAQQAWADDALLDKPVTVPWGQAPGRQALGATSARHWCTAGTWPSPPDNRPKPAQRSSSPQLWRSAASFLPTLACPACPSPRSWSPALGRAPLSAWPTGPAGPPSAGSDPRGRNHDATAPDEPRVRDPSVGGAIPAAPGGRGRLSRDLVPKPIVYRARPSVRRARSCTSVT